MPIPEFILRTLFVPDSYRFEHSKFIFQLNNTFAPGTITRLKVIVNDVELPLDQVSYQIQGQPPALASEISIQNPAPIPTGIVINISGKVALRPRKLILWAETKEAGTVRFTVFDDTGRDRFKLASLPILHRPLHTTLEIDPKKTIKLLKCLPQALVDPETQQNFNRRNSAGPFLIPRQSIGIIARLSESTVISPFSFPDIVGATRTDQFDLENLRFCQGSDQKCIFKIDSDQLTTGRPPDWLNISDPSYAADWIIAGPAWQPWEISLESARVYARKVAQFARELRLVHPESRVGMQCKFVASESTDDLSRQWNEAAFAEAGKSIDFVYWQFPSFEPDVDTVGMQGKSLLKVLTAHVAKIHLAIGDIKTQCSKSSPDRRIAQAIDLTSFYASLLCHVHNHLLPLQQADLEMIWLKSLASLYANSSELLFATLAKRDQYLDLTAYFEKLFALACSKENNQAPRLFLPNIRSAAKTGLSYVSTPDEELSALLLFSPSSKYLMVVLANLHTDRFLSVNLAFAQTPGSTRPGKKHTVILKPRSIKRYSFRMR